MSVRRTPISHNGSTRDAFAVEVDGTTVVSTGRLLKQAAIFDESFSESTLWMNPERLIAEVQRQRLPADILTFVPSLDRTEPTFPFYSEADNAAVIDTSDISAWWESLPQSTRKNCRRAERRGVATAPVAFADTLCVGIKSLYDEAPFRQGRRFWHFGKPLERVTQENGTYLDRTQFVASFYGSELIGFAKLVYVGRIARIMQILSANAHADKRPMNALIAKSAEVAAARGMRYLVYSKFQYGHGADNPLTVFKERNGFRRLDFPRYYVPLTVRGRASIACRLHRGPQGLLPSRLLRPVLALRATFNDWRASRQPSRFAGVAQG